jgi:hypothetical protein
MSNANVMTVIGNNSVHGKSYDLMAVVLKHINSVTHACGMVMLKATDWNADKVVIDSSGTLDYARIEYNVGFLRGPCEHMSMCKAKLTARFGKTDNLKCSNILMNIIKGITKVK